MNQPPGVPSRIEVSGDGLSQMDPGQYVMFARRLAKMGMYVSVLGDAEPGETDVGIPTTRMRDLTEFGQEFGYSEKLVDRVWSGLQLAYAANRSEWEQKFLAEEDAIKPRHPALITCPIKFIENPAYAKKGIPTPWYALEEVVTDSLLSTVGWLKTYPAGFVPVKGYGSHSVSFLAHYVNEHLNPSSPFNIDKAKHSQRVALPAEDEFQLNTNSPFIEKVAGNKRKIPLTSVQSMRHYAKSIDIQDSQARPLPRFLESAVRHLLGDSFPDLDLEKDSPAEPISNGVWFLGSEMSSRRYNKRRSLYIPRWGVVPKTLLGIVHQAARREVILADINGQTTGYIVARYLNAIDKPG